MKTFLRVLLYSLLGVAVFVTACYIRGMYLPERSTTEASITIMAPHNQVWSTLTNSALLPQWRKSVTAVEPLPTEDGDPCIQQVQGGTRSKLCEHVNTPGKSVVFRVDDKAFKGTWLVEINPIPPSATHVTIAQDGGFANPWTRFLAYQFGIDSEIKGVESDLKAYVEKSQK